MPLFYCGMRDMMRDISAMMRDMMRDRTWLRPDFQLRVLWVPRIKVQVSRILSRINRLNYQ